MTDLPTHRILRWVSDAPDALAVVTADGAYSYRELGDAVSGVSRAVSGADRVAILPTSDLGSLAAVIGAMDVGTSVVLLHRHLTPEHLGHALDVASPAHIIASERMQRRLALLDSTLDTTTPQQLRPRGNRHRNASPTDELLVGLTSGTTGAPKLFVRNQLSWARTLDRSDEEFTVDLHSRVATPGVLDHTHFLYGAIHTLSRGAAVDLRTPTAWGSDHPTHVYTVPSIAWDLASVGSGSITSVREVMSSAAQWSRSARDALQRRLPHATLAHFYGASELSFVAVDTSVEDGPEHTAGRPFTGVDIEIRDGIVHVRSDMLFDGYLTEAGVSGGPVDGWASVGDRGTFDDGWLFLAGRSSDTLIRGGLNVEPADVERVLLSCDGILDAACVGLPDARWGEVPVAVVVTTEPAPDSLAVRRYLRRQLPEPSMPTRMHRTRTLPRTARGKVDRSGLLATLTSLPRL